MSSRSPARTPSRRTLLCLIAAGLVGPLTAAAVPYRRLDGRIYFVVLNAHEVARRGTGDLLADLGRFLGVIDDQVAGAIIDRLMASYADQGVEAAVQHSSEVLGSSSWWYHDGDKLHEVRVEGGTYEVISVDVLNARALARQKLGPGRLGIAQLLGMSIEGRVNWQVLDATLDQLRAHGISVVFWVGDA